jgi:O-acetyl-ADP-ribose deacetylase (regulator of RNase III)
MIKIIEGDILQSDCNIIVHQVNCQGVMGSGIAKQIREKYPTVFEDYKEYIANYIYNSAPTGLLGSVNLSSIGEDKFIANLFGQWGYGYDGGLYTNIAALKCGLQSIKDYAIEHQYSVCIPYNIGCCRGGADWNEVSNIINNIFDNSGIYVEIRRLDLN